MKARRSICSLRADLDKFLFAAVGEEIEGAPLSVVSALARLGLDPWEEAGRLSALSSHEAIEQLARLVAELPGRPCPLAEARRIARPLVVLLPKHNGGASTAAQIQVRPHYPRLTVPRPSLYWIVCAVLIAAALFSAFAHHELQFGIGADPRSIAPQHSIVFSGDTNVRPSEDRK
jgi:hypothetical protein